MAQTTFSGPVRSLNGFIGVGSGNVVNVANGTNTLALTVSAHAGRVLTTNDATLVLTLPAIIATTPTDTTDPNQTNNLGATFTVFIDTAATAVAISTDGTDKYVGSVLMVDTDSSGAVAGYAPASTNDVINLNGTTTGGIAGSWVQITAIAANEWYVSGVLLGSGSVATPFADA
jgi:hypothetical protein